MSLASPAHSSSFIQQSLRHRRPIISTSPARNAAAMGDKRPARFGALMVHLHGSINFEVSMKHEAIEAY